MRLWSLHPRYLDTRGLTAAWREALLAQAVIAGRTRGYRHHPQLSRFYESPSPPAYIAAYLQAIHAEATRRGYRFDAARIGLGDERAGEIAVGQLPVARGQLVHEWAHLVAKLERRSPAWLEQIGSVRRPEPHPLFRAVAGGVADWEVIPVAALPKRSG